LRGSQHPDRDLVNMLLTDLSRLDFRQLFICHKPLFYEAYRDWSDSQKDFVVRFLEQEYAMDKAGAREALFGGEPSMQDESKLRERPSPKRKNPWNQSEPRKKDGWKRDDDDDDDYDGWSKKSKQRRAYEKRQRDKDGRKKR
jgi:hypothetical protein